MIYMIKSLSYFFDHIQLKCTCRLTNLSVDILKDLIQAHYLINVSTLSILRHSKMISLGILNVS